MALQFIVRRYLAEDKEKSLPEVEFRKAFVELMVVETTTSSMRTKRSTN